MIRRTWTHDPARYAPPRHRRACAYDAFDPLPVAGDAFPLPAAVAGAVSEAERAVSALNAGPRPALAPLARLLLRTESIASSKVEGLQADPRTLARAEARGDLGADLGRDVAEVLANIDAMQLAVEEATPPASVGIDGVRAIHAALLRTAPGPAAGGRLREEQNWIGGNDWTPCGADFVPPPPERVVPLLEDLLAFMDDDALPPLAQAAIAHAQFETIHPFADGNGRTGRALIHVVLRRRGLAPAFVPPVSVVLARRRSAYIAGLTAFRKGDVAGWVERFAAAAAEAAGVAASYLEAVAALQDGWRERLRARRAPRSDSAVWDVIEVLPAHPVVTVAVGCAATGRTKPAVNQAMALLADAGVLSPLSDSRRNRAWEAAGVLELLAGLEAGATPG
jgi:Fic family protein